MVVGGGRAGKKKTSSKAPIEEPKERETNRRKGEGNARREGEKNRGEIRNLETDRKAESSCRS